MTELSTMNLQSADALSSDSPRNFGTAKKYDTTMVNAVKKKDEATTESRKKSERFSFKQVKWMNVIQIAIFHVGSIYAFATFPYIQRFKTFCFAYLMMYVTGFGIGAGVHRLWTHRSYKAKIPLRIFLYWAYCSAGLNPLYSWVRDHRVHHRFVDTDADPHNSNRGFFFSHVGWLMLPKHPEVIKRGREIDMSDLLADPVVAFGEKYFPLLKILFCFVLPVIIPVYFWNEDWYYAIMSQWFMRYVYVLNALWSVNSLAHKIGWRPYDKTIAPTENIWVSWFTGGEGWHNYHHVFPWDYKTSEIIHALNIDYSTYFINLAAAMGLAYDLKQPSEELIRKMIAKKGDGSHAEVPLPLDETKVT